METNRKIAEILFAIVFILLTVVMGYLSFVNLVKFYVNDEVDYNEWTADLGNKFETDEATTFFEKFQFVNLNGAIRNLIGQKEMNGITKLNNGHLAIPQARISNGKIEVHANEVIKYVDFCKENGKLVLFVQPILKIDKDNKQLPVGVEDYSNENIDIFLSYLRDADIDVLDIRDCMKNDEMDMYDYTYITDHHWTTIGCFYSFVQITKWIETKTGIKINEKITDINNYEIKEYSKWHLGSYGQRCGAYFAGIDNYDLIVPSFDVLFIDKNGNAKSFYDQVVNTSVFENRNAKSRYTYDRALQCPEGVASTSQKLSLLFVSDSYATAMAPYLKLAYSDYHIQYYPCGFNADYVLKSEPDVVVIMPFNTSTFSGGAVFKCIVQ